MRTVGFVSWWLRPRVSNRRVARNLLQCTFRSRKENEIQSAGLRDFPAMTSCKNKRRTGLKALQTQAQEGNASDSDPHKETSRLGAERSGKKWQVSFDCGEERRANVEQAENGGGQKIFFL